VKRVIGLEVGSHRVVVAIAEADSSPLVVYGAAGAHPIPRQPWGKWSLHRDAAVQRSAHEHMASLYRLLRDHGVGSAELTVLAVPPGYGDERVAALVDAVVAAGFPSLRVLDEGVATALGVGRSWLSAPGLVVDLGASHAAATVVTLGATHIESVASDGTEETSLGEVAQRLCDELAAQLEKASSTPLAAGQRALLLDDLRGALAGYRAGPLRVRSLAPGGESPWELVIPEAAMRWLRTELVEGVAALGESVMVRAKIHPGRLARAWLTGPAATDDGLRAMLSERLRCELRPVSPDLIACGAARYGAELLGSTAHTPLPPPAARDDHPLPLLEVVEVDRSSAPPSSPPGPSDPRWDEPVAHPPLTSEVSGLRVTGPPASAHQLPRAGTFRGARTPVELLGMPLMRAPTETELHEPYLPVILLQLATAQATGAISVTRERESVKLFLSRGGVCIAPLDRGRVQRIFDWPRGDFAWREEPPPPALTKLRQPTFGFVASGLRLALRGMADEAVLAAFGPRLALSPVVIPERRRRALAMEFGPAEQRAVDHMLDGTRDVMSLLGEGYIGRLTYMRVLLLLDAFGALRWQSVPESHGEDPVDRLRRSLARMEHEDHFTALNLHWTATHDEVIEAWEAFQIQCAPDGRWAAVDRGITAKILARGAAAWEALRDDKRRVDYRHKLHPTVDETMLSAVVASQAELLAFRGEVKVANAMRSLAVEMAASAPPTAPLKGS
jgi:hypothetical protein